MDVAAQHQTCTPAQPLLTLLLGRFSLLVQAVLLLLLSLSFVRLTGVHRGVPFCLPALLLATAFGLRARFAAGRWSLLACFAYSWPQRRIRFTRGLISPIRSDRGPTCHTDHARIARDPMPSRNSWGRLGGAAESGCRAQRADVFLMRFHLAGRFGLLSPPENLKLSGSVRGTPRAHSGGRLSRASPFTGDLSDTRPV